MSTNNWYRAIKVIFHNRIPADSLKPTDDQYAENIKKHDQFHVQY